MPRSTSPPILARRRGLAPTGFGQDHRNEHRDVRHEERRDDRRDFRHEARRDEHRGFAEHRDHAQFSGRSGIN